VNHDLEPPLTLPNATEDAPLPPTSNRNGLETRAGIHGASGSRSGSKVLVLHSIPMTLDAFYQTSLHTEGLFAHTHDGGQVERKNALRDT